ncbi:MAG: hypothetical protein KJ559_00215 [Nanoarchaeota archaeon]|nr:hypothetical protein [Nanoarchaeota archaeon]
MEVEEERTRLKVPSKDGEIVFVYPAKRGDIWRLEKQCNEDNTTLPVLSQQIDLFYDAEVTDPKNKYSREISELMREGQGYVLTGVLWIEEGMYAKDCTSVSEIESMNERELQEKLNGDTHNHVIFSKEGLIRFTPYENIIYREQKPNKFPENPGVIALSGKIALQEPEKLEQLAKQFQCKPGFLGLRKQEVNKPIQRFAVLGSYFDGFGLTFDGHYPYNLNGDCFAFGVEKSGRDICV